jgi:hypothetical protein
MEKLWGKGACLTIQLLARFSFGGQTSKSDIFHHQLLKPFTIGHQVVLIGDFNFFPHFHIIL